MAGYTVVCGDNIRNVKNLDTARELAQTFLINHPRQGYSYIYVGEYVKGKDYKYIVRAGYHATPKEVLGRGDSMEIAERIGKTGALGPFMKINIDGTLNRYYRRH